MAGDKPVSLRFLLAQLLEAGLAAGPWSLTDYGKRAEMKLKTNPYDLESWSVLLREAQVSLRRGLMVQVL